MKTFRNFIKDEYDIEMPTENIPETWFHENGFPMIVSCTCCGMTMASPTALIDEDGNCYCTCCGHM